MEFVRKCSAYLFVLFLLTACQGAALKTEPNLGSQDDPIKLVVLYTNDEHGWMLGEKGRQLAAEMSGIWADEFSDHDAVLILSGGDNWTGPAISTWFKGESMVEVMNAMGYRASVIGNHEFDFGLEVLKNRTEQAGFPYLGANIHYSKDGAVPVDLGIQPYTIMEAAGIDIGVIGLANVDTPATTNPTIVSGFQFDGYAETLREIVPEVRESGADLIFVASHACTWELAPLARDVSDLGITLFGGGHCHERVANTIAESVILSGGSYFEHFAFASFQIDPVKGAILDVDYGVIANQEGTANPRIAEIVTHWEFETSQELDTAIGFLEHEIPQRSEEMAALITETWLLGYPADVALTNWGGMRDQIPRGDITYASLINVMPFENVLVDVALTGAQLEKVLDFGNGSPPVGGIHRGSGEWVLDKTGEPLDPKGVYNLLVSDFLYAGGDDYVMLAEFDLYAYNTAISWRQPVIDWIITQGSGPQSPLDEAIKGLLD
jgi:2',3'-cyclic-nucleotide 2'-phosphodiesterase (5'-nucleotidase family)